MLWLGGSSIECLQSLQWNWLLWSKILWLVLQAMAMSLRAAGPAKAQLGIKGSANGRTRTTALQSRRDGEGSVCVSPS